MDFTTYRPASSRRRRRPLLLRWLVVGTILGLVLTGAIYVVSQWVGGSTITAGEVRADLRQLWANQAWQEIVSYTEQELLRNPIEPNYLLFAGLGHFYSSTEATDGDTRNGHLTSSVRYLRRFLALNVPRMLPEVNFVLGKAYYSLGRYYADLSVLHLEKALEIGYTDREVWNFLGLAYSALEKYDRAEYFFERALNLTESDLIRWSLAFVQFKSGKLKEAEKNLQLALMNSEDPALIRKCRLFLAEIYLRDNQFDKSEQEYQKILETDPNSSEVYFFLGEIYSKKGEPERARAFWRRALQLDPYHYNAALRLRSN